MHLKLCPFCKSDDVSIIEFGEGARQKHHVHCSNCLADGPIKATKVQAADAWNTRPDGKSGDGHEESRTKRRN